MSIATNSSVINKQVMMKHAILITGCDTGFGFSLALDQAEKEADLLVLACCYQPESEGAKQLKPKNNI